MSLRNATLEDIKKWDHSNIDACIDYFEFGCLCIHSGKLPVLMDATPHELVLHYVKGCECSRHPEGEKA